MSQPREPRDPLPAREALGRLGLSHAALAAMIAGELGEAEVGLLGQPVADAVAHAIESNNAEILRQLVGLLGDLERFRAEPVGQGE